MALNVEVGNGASNSDSYVTTQNVTDYLTDYNHPQLATWTALIVSNLAAAEAHCRIGTRWVDQFEHRMQGRKLNNTQALALPRVGIKDHSGYVIEYTPLPQQALDATCLMVAESVAGDDLTPSIAAGGGSLTRRTIKTGEILSTKEYAGAGSRQTKRYTLAESLLEELLEPAGRVIRA